MITSSEKLIQRIEALQADERIILETLLDRIEKGREQYGPWQISDGRNYAKEAFEEIIDALHYSAAALIKQSRVISPDESRGKTS